MTKTTQLLIPMALRAMLVNQPVLNGTKFRRWQNNYSHLVNNMDSPTPAPFQDGGDAPKQGIHLHWKLPQALKHGRPGTILFTVTGTVANIVNALNKNVVSSDLAAAFSRNSLALAATGVSVAPKEDANTRGWQVIDWPNAHHYLIELKQDTTNIQYLAVSDARISFPEVPNRWLVIRFQNGMSKVDPTSWIVESDYLNAADGTVSFLDPQSQNLASLNAVSKIGKSQLLTASWTENAATGTMYLRAVGPGDVTFSAYAPAAQNVFSFVDSDAANLPENTALTYLVAGWYANPNFDPLQSASGQTADFVAQLNSLNWAIEGVSDLGQYTGPVATQSIVHGMLHSLVWQTARMPLGDATQVPDDIGNSVKVAIGNTSVEALSALIGVTSGDQDIDLTLLEALQYGSLEELDDVGGRTLVADKARQARYGATSGGQSWEIRAREVNGAALPAAEPPDLSDYAAGLAALNTAQATLNANQRKLASLQWTLYARWWKNQNYNVLGLGPANPPDNMTQIAAALAATSPEYQALVREIQRMQQKIAAAFTSRSIPVSTDAVSIAAYAKDVLKLPSSLLLKPKSAPRYWHPNDPVLLISGIANPDNAMSTEALPCRTLRQIVTGLTINGKTVTADNSAALIPMPIANASIPAPVYALCKETFFLDPANWQNIASNLFMGNVQPTDIGMAIGNGAWADASSYAPLPMAVSAWVQPWDPLFLEWSIKWFPTYSQKDASSPWQFQRNEWQFDGDDYHWTGVHLDESLVVGYTGRTVLSSHSVFNFENRLRDYIAKSRTPQPKLKKLDTLLTAIRSWGVMSQRLSGLHDGFVTRSSGQAWPPIGDVAALVQNQYQSSPDPSKGDQDYDQGPVSPTFFPQMGGFFVIDDIEVVDSFGQSVSLLSANNNPTGGKASAFTPIRSKQITPANPNIAVGDYTPAQFVQQSFSLVQPAQLAMRWVDATNDANEVGLAADANPVCGWLLPNHLDVALAVYDQQGQLLGEVRKDLNQTTVSWYPAPDSLTPITTPDQIPNTHLRGVVTGLMAAQKQATTTFDNFVKVIDESLWLVDPLCPRSDPDMAVLIGRPLAVLRLKLALELEGDAYTNQSWADTFTANDNAISQTGFVVRLGSLALRKDGLIGYYADDSFQTFNSVHYPSGLDTSSPYVKLIGGKAGNYLSLMPNGSPAFVTLLMDPRGSLHGATGILPVKEISLPHGFFESALSNMEVTFSVGSLLTSAASIQIPRLAEQNGAWSWISHSSTTQFESNAVAFSSPNAQLSAPSMVIQDGWLRFLANLDKDAADE
ncbi:MULTISPECIES: hypothetical protein [Burkholderiaceae]|uniref:hypothetical protein n=1 Tax=Burkholderiaceae TaxID=119060 RepID=UPI0011159676|nr:MULTISPECIES: hypothetical protein [Burkholderiaceae]MCF2133793.1 hypothetical protein [Mycetohabitans sp. B3]